MFCVSAWSDRKVEEVIATLLRTGVLLSAAIVFLGGAIYLARQGASPADYHVFRGEPNELRQISGILHQAISLRGRGVIQLGLLLLIATPVARVIFSIFGFAAEKDYLYVGFASVVLLILLYSLLGSS
jgi:uncharacterized membrane protein